MSKQNLWYGFLEAGSKSSPVAIDYGMDTGDSLKLFIYNHNKQEILKYHRELVEPKLRELTDTEKELEANLKKGFKAALSTMAYSVAKTMSAPAKNKPASKVETVPEPKDPEAVMSELDDDIWEDSED